MASASLALLKSSQNEVVVDFTQGFIQSNQQITMGPEDILKVRLPENPTTGHSWMVFVSDLEKSD